MRCAITAVSMLVLATAPGCFLDHGRDVARGVPCPVVICPVGQVCQVCTETFRCVAPDAIMGCEGGGLPYGIQLWCDGDEDCDAGERCAEYVADLSEGMRCAP